MGQIQVLSFEVANLIAAGEVVDRPASAIKEMMENAIDAGAKHITVEIQNGGVTLMRVTDDGCGMSEEDLPMAIRRHATSKIRDAADLDGIFTLGFRGEALAAISSVSDMRILSKRREDAMGHMLEVRGGTFLGVSEYGCRDGTTVIVEDLFANVPARRKFLKRDATEAMAVAANVERVALSHPEIAVRLISDGVQKLETAGDGQLKSAVWAVFGRDFASKLLPLDGEHEGIRITGFVGRSDNVKANRNGQNFFINHRYVRSRTAQAALEQAFVSYIPPEKYPCCIMNIGLNPARVDVNVHPAKLEVKFSNEKPIFEAVYYAVRQALEQNVTRPEMTLSDQRSSIGIGKVSEATTPVELERPESLARRQITMAAPATSGEKKEHFAHMTAEEYRRLGTSGKSSSEPHYTAVPAGKIQAPPPAEEIPMEVLDAEARRMFGSAAPSAAPTFPPKPVPEPEHPPVATPASAVPQPPTLASEPPPEPAKPPVVSEEPHVQVTGEPETLTNYRVVGEVFHSYVIVEVADPTEGEKMLLIDKHAAHERIIFEDLKSRMKDKHVESQLLLIPLEVMLMSGEVGLLDAYRPELEAVGFTYACQRNSVLIDSIPAGIDPGAVPDMIIAIAEQLLRDVNGAKLTRDIFFEKALYQASCKAAIKAGRDYPPESIKWLVDRLMALPDITFCPHGRPVAMEMKKRQIDHQFERC